MLCFLTVYFVHKPESIYDKVNAKTVKGWVSHRTEKEPKRIKFKRRCSPSAIFTLVVCLLTS